MNQLIHIQPQTINGNVVETVSARELHGFLESKQEFTNWIKNRIEKYNFVESVDFLINLSKTPSGGRPTTEYYITLDMAKQLAMVENNDKGMQARRYFIECEKQLMQTKQLPQTNAEFILMVAQQLVEQERKSVELEQRLAVVEHTQQRLDQENNHYTIKGFCSLHNIDLSNGKMSALSKKAKKLSEVKEYPYHEITDPRFGKVKCYHIDILTELFQMQKLL